MKRPMPGSSVQSSSVADVSEMEKELGRCSAQLVNDVTTGRYDALVYRTHYLLAHGRHQVLRHPLLIAFNALEIVAPEGAPGSVSRRFSNLADHLKLLILRTIHLYLELALSLYQINPSTLDDSQLSSIRKSIEAAGKQGSLNNPALAYEYSCITACLTSFTTDANLFLKTGVTIAQSVAGHYDSVLPTFLDLKSRLPSRWYADVRYIRQMAAELARAASLDFSDEAAETSSASLESASAMESKYTEAPTQVLAPLKAELLKQLNELQSYAVERFKATLKSMPTVKLGTLLHPLRIEYVGESCIARAMIQAMGEVVKSTRDLDVAAKALAILEPYLDFDFFPGVRSPIRYVAAQVCAELQFHSVAYVSTWAANKLSEMRSHESEKEAVLAATLETDNSALWRKWKDYQASAVDALEVLHVGIASVEHRVNETAAEMNETVVKATAQAVVASTTGNPLLRRGATLEKVGLFAVGATGGAGVMPTPPVIEKNVEKADTPIEMADAPMTGAGAGAGRSLSAEFALERSFMLRRGMDRDIDRETFFEMNFPDELYRHRVARESAAEALALSSEPNVPMYYLSNHRDHRLSALLAEHAEGVQWVAISGMAGSGKTTLAHKYVADYRKTHPEALTLILVTETLAQLKQRLKEIAATSIGTTQLEAQLMALNSEAQEDLIRRLVRAHLGSRKNWVLVLDNMDREAPALLEYLRPLLETAGPGQVLITTQHSHLRIAGLQHLDLNTGLTHEESALLIHNLLEPIQDYIQLLGTEEDLTALVTELDGIPLALVQAGSYLLEYNRRHLELGEHLTYREYLSLIQEASVEVETRHHLLLTEVTTAPHTEDGRFKSQLASLSLSLDKALHLKNEGEPNLNVWRLLNFCSLLEPTHIPQALLWSFAEKIGLTFEEFSQCIEIARSYSLLLLEEEKSPVDGKAAFSMHRSIQHTLRHYYQPQLMQWLARLTPVRATASAEATPVNTEAVVATGITESNSSVEEQESILVLNSLKELMERLIDEEKYEEERVLIPHAQHLVENFKLESTASRKLILTWAEAYWALAVVYQATLDKAEHARQILEEQVLPKVIAYFGEEQIEVARARLNLAHAYGALGQAERKRQILEDQVLPKFSDHYGKEHIAVTEVRWELANACGALGQAERKRQILEDQVLPKFLTHTDYGEAHIQVARVREGLANAYGALDQPERKRQILEDQVLPKFIAHYGEKHIKVAWVHWALAYAYGSLGQAEQHRQILEEQVLPKYIAHYGEEHIQVAHLYLDLADTHRALGNSNRQRKILEEQVLPRYIDNMKDIKVARVFLSLANAYGDLGYIECQRDLLVAEVLPKFIEHYGEAHVEVGIARACLAFALCELKNYVEAEKEIRQALGIFAEKLGSDHEIILYEQQLLADINTVRIEENRMSAEAEAAVRPSRCVIM